MLSLVLAVESVVHVPVALDALVEGLALVVHALALALALALAVVRSKLVAGDGVAAALAGYVAGYVERVAFAPAVFVAGFGPVMNEQVVVCEFALVDVVGVVLAALAALANAAVAAVAAAVVATAIAEVGRDLAEALVVQAAEVVIQTW